jgi:TetR/AcrR family transcriptional regulator, tetracycline repressor protein
VSRSEFEISGRRSESHRAKGRVALTRADVVKVGAQLLDREGLEGLSMRKLATTLGTGPATLYWHVRDKNELLSLILDETMRPVRISESGTWDERVVSVLAASRRALAPRPTLVRFIWDAGWNPGTETLRVADGLTGLVAESGLPDDEVADAYFGLITYLFGFVLAETAGAGHAPMGAASTADAGLYQNLLRYGPATDPAGMDRRFRYGLDRALEGIKERAAKAPRGTSRRR